MIVILKYGDFLVILSTGKQPFCVRTSVLFCTHTTVIPLSVDGGERAVIFDRFRGVLPHVVGEGTHFLIPWVQRPVIFSVRSKPRRIPVVTGSKGIA